MLHGADALVVVTEWKEFKCPDFEGMVAALKQPVVFDGRNLYEPALMAGHGIEYHGVGRGASVRTPAALFFLAEAKSTSLLYLKRDS